MQTKDVFDVMSIPTYYLIGDAIAAFVGKALSSMPLGGSLPGGNQPFAVPLDPSAAFANFSRGGGRRQLPPGMRPRGPRGLGQRPRPR